MLWKKMLNAIAVAALLMVPLTAGAGQKQQAENKKIVREFYDLAFNQRKPQEAAEQFISERFVQHNPSVADGKEAFVEYFKSYFTQHPEAHVLIKQAIAEDDLVALHVHAKKDLADRGTAIIDIFRLEKGKIVEHWDVIQPVPPKAQNANTMF